ncbi:MAG: HAMP domain-containing histidine kinase [Actinomycetales bacterium]|nr:HAMP domain-containing histidine kinase [Actinomycetales bacterium]
MLPLPDLPLVVAIALVPALAVGTLGLLALRVLRRRSVLLQVVVVALAAVASVVAGMIATARAMIVSDHDLAVTVTVAVVAGLVAIAVALVLGRSFTRTLQRLRGLAQAVGSGTPLEPGRSVDSAEFARLAEELAQTSRRLDEARAGLDAAESDRRELIAWISHDLRTPLAGLRAMSEALEDGLAPEPERFLQQMRGQVDRMSGLVDSLFELSRIQSGTLTLDRAPVALRDLVSDTIAELGPVAEARGVGLEGSAERDVDAVGDARALARVLGNLVMNAIEHSPAGAAVQVSLRHEGGVAILCVTDRAGGIPEADRANVFRPGWRASASRTPGAGLERSTGAGLGLAIVRGLVEAHGGTVALVPVESGSRFEVRLPVA